MQQTLLTWDWFNHFSCNPYFLIITIFVLIFIGILLLTNIALIKEFKVFGMSFTIQPDNKITIRKCIGLILIIVPITIFLFVIFCPKIFPATISNCCDEFELHKIIESEAEAVVNSDFHAIDTLYIQNRILIHGDREEPFESHYNFTNARFLHAINYSIVLLSMDKNSALFRSKSCGKIKFSNGSEQEYYSDMNTWEFIKNSDGRWKIKKFTFK